MIIDDDKELLEELKETLQLSGYDVVALDDSTRVLEVANSARPDVILLDLKMPKKSGFQVADELKRVQQLICVPIIAISGFVKEDYLPLMDLCGIKKYIKKPFTPQDIIAQIEEVLTIDKNVNKN
jgi:DNA-binding response OmpR family regulator